MSADVSELPSWESGCFRLKQYGVLLKLVKKATNRNQEVLSKDGSHGCDGYPSCHGPRTYLTKGSLATQDNQVFLQREDEVTPISAAPYPPVTEGHPSFLRASCRSLMLATGPFSSPIHNFRHLASWPPLIRPGTRLPSADFGPLDSHHPSQWSAKLTCGATQTLSLIPPRSCSHAFGRLGQTPSTPDCKGLKTPSKIPNGSLLRSPPSTRHLALKRPGRSRAR